MPFWILPTLGSFIFPSKPELGEIIRKGEGLVYASAILGPLVYVLTRRYGRFSFYFKKPIQSTLSISFPYGGMFVLVTAVACTVSGFSFAVLRTGEKTTQPYDEHGITVLSWLLMACATGVFYLVAAYRNMLDELERQPEVIVSEQSKQTDEFSEQWQREKTQ